MPLNKGQLTPDGLQITVDGDTSTNDTCIGLASGAAGNDIIKHSTSEAAQKLEAAVTALLQVGLQFAMVSLCISVTTINAEKQKKKKKTDRCSNRVWSQHTNQMLHCNIVSCLKNGFEVADNT